MKKALVFSAGGVKGAFQVGVVKQLLDAGNDYDIFSGISVGAFNASILAQAKENDIRSKYNSLFNIWKGIKKNRHIYRNWWYLPFIGHLAGLLFKNSIYNSKPLQKLIERNVKDKEFPRELIIGAVSYEGGEYRKLSTRDDNFVSKNFYKWVMASTAVPMVLTPITINKQNWIDGGVRTYTPLNAVIDAGADYVDVILTSPRNAMKRDPKHILGGDGINGVKVGLRSIELMANEILLRDFKTANLINQLSIENENHCIHLDGIKKRFITINIYAPEVQLVNNSLKFSQKIVDQLIETGVNCGSQSLADFLS